MIRRGSAFWMWTDHVLTVRRHHEVLSDGTQVEVLARHSRQACAQVFIALYAECGEPILEQALEFDVGLPLADALDEGIGELELFLAHHRGFISPHKIRPTLHLYSEHGDIPVPAQDLPARLEAQRKRVNDEYLSAKAVVVSLMKKKQVDPAMRERAQQRLFIAIDRMVALPRVQLSEHPA